LVPFRYEKPATVENLASHLEEAFDQFRRYLILRPPMGNLPRPLEASRLKEIGGALDAEYGWFVPARPGGAGKLVGELAQANVELARLLFNPSLYPVLGK